MGLDSFFRKKAEQPEKTEKPKSDEPDQTRRELLMGLGVLAATSALVVSGPLVKMGAQLKAEAEAEDRERQRRRIRGTVTSLDEKGEISVEVEGKLYKMMLEGNSEGIKAGESVTAWLDVRKPEEPRLIKVEKYGSIF